VRERSVEKTIVQWAKKNGIRVLKLAGMHNRGKSDRMFLRRGKTAFMEIKAPGETPTELQFKFLKEHEDEGFPSAWFDDAGLAIQWLKKTFDV
jgi:hypothetical protein